jgi:aryl-alcohol dehydrogenase-like predicted oxidoreductase
MQYRQLGRTGLYISEVGFGAWAIGGTSYGRVQRAVALRALARAEALGCNFVDTAAVYGDSESILGKFLSGRRDRWVIASKYSGQPQGMTALVEEQLSRLGTDCIDFYQIHWAPHQSGADLYEELERLRSAGKLRYAGVSLYSAADIDFVLGHPSIDAFQVAFSLLDPRPLLSRLEAVKQSGRGVVVRSALKDGFLTGRYSSGSVFTDPDDQRHTWSRARVSATAKAANRFAFLAEETGSMLAAAVRYPLSFDVVSTVILSTKDEVQAGMNFGGAFPPLPDYALEQVRTVQASLGLLSDGLSGRMRRAAHRAVAAVRRS